MSRAKNLDRVPPKVERITEFEVYLLDEQNQRIKRICGHKRNAVPNEFPCLVDAGYGTEHSGVGFCLKHDSTGMKSDFLISGETDFPETVRSAVDRIRDMDDSQMSDLDGDIKVLYALLQFIMTGTGTDDNNRVLSKEGVKTATQIIQKIIDAKKTKHDLRKTMSIDVKMIRAFLNQVLGIIRRNVDEATSNRIFTEILQQVVFPMQRKELISGEPGDLLNE
ncbi:MAG: hypothetical protein FK733_00085 [Asgard group archaeon]|nr:hypothetical protein [Asgard group archaeon]